MSDATPISTATQPDAPALPEAVLWTVEDAARYVRKSKRWLYDALATPENQLGSIPHVRLGRSPRFVPDDVRAWAEQGFPPAATFREWKELESRQRRRK